MRNNKIRQKNDYFYLTLWILLGAFIITSESVSHFTCQSSGEMFQSLTVPPTIKAYAATKINSISIRFEASEFDEEGFPVVDAVAKSKKYSVSTIDTAFDYYGTDNSYAEGDNTYVVELEAADGYYFNVSRSSDLRLSGAGAEFIKASRKDNGQILTVTVRLSCLEEFLGDISEAGWEESGRAYWNDTYGATLYRLSIMDPDGHQKRAVTGGTVYDFRPFMQTAGTYEYRVQPQSSSGKSGRWQDGGSCTVTEERAEANREEFKVEVSYQFKNDIETPENCIKEYHNTGWQAEADGRYWYRNNDASYPQYVWWKEGGDWYFFGQDGYMLQNQYISWAGGEYYLGNDGKMIVNTIVPDGRHADQTGKLQ